MMKTRKRTLSLLCAGLLALSLTACAPAQQPQSSAEPVISTGSHHRRWNSRGEKYTQADYDLAMSFQVDGYGEMTVDAFNRSVLDWDDEEAYHKTEEALQRLFNTLPDNDANADFILEVLGATWTECEKKHYNACQRNTNPWYSGWATYETYGDVYGDPLLLTGAYADFEFDYQIPDGAALTVAKRQELLQGVEQGVQQFLSKQGEAQLKQEENMEKTLKKELERLLGNLKDGIAWGGEVAVGYYYEENWRYSDLSNEVTAGGGTAQTAYAGETYGKYTQKQYDQALAALQFEGWETMPVSEFDRKVQAALNGGDGDGSLNFSYEMVREFLPETDANAFFFQTTVQAALREYDAKVLEVLSRKQVDPEWHYEVETDIKEDVFGDEVTTGGAAGYGTFTYQIVDADALTVQERDAFLRAVAESAEAFVQQALKERKGDEAAFKQALEAAGKAAGTEKIRFTGCEIDYFEVY